MFLITNILLYVLLLYECSGYISNQFFSYNSYTINSKNSNKNSNNKIYSDIPIQLCKEKLRLNSKFSKGFSNIFPGIPFNLKYSKITCCVLSVEPVSHIQ